MSKKTKWEMKVTGLSLHDLQKQKSVKTKHEENEYRCTEKG